MSGLGRALLIALAVFVGIPLLMIVLSLGIETVAVIFAFFVAPQLAYAYPTMLFPVLAGFEPFASIVLVGIVCGAFALRFRHEDAKSQFLAALLCCAAWWVCWRVLALMFGLHPPPMNLHM